MMRIASVSLGCRATIAASHTTPPGINAMRAFLLAALALSNPGSAALAAEIHVMTGGAPKEVLTALAPEFEKRTGHNVRFTYAVISAIQQKLAAGEKPDMVLMPAPALE